MSLGDLTKQLAKEALGAQVDEMMDSIRPGDPAAKPAPPDSAAAAVMSEVQAMQNALKEDQELVVTCAAGRDTVRVFEIFAPNPRLLVLSGIDGERAVTRILLAADRVELVCRPQPVKEGAKPARLRLVMPKK